MKIRTSIAQSEMRNIARAVGVTFSRCIVGGARSHAASYDIVLSGSGRRRNCEGDVGATWDEWGAFLARIFAVDPSTTTGVYRNSAHFTWSTNDRYNLGNPEGTSCPDHKWQYEGSSPGNSYQVHSCAKNCGATRRFATPDYVKENFLS